MAIPVKSQEQILQEILNEIVIDSKTGLATYENSAVRDIFINPLRDQVYDTNIITDFVSRSGSINEMIQVVLTPSYIDSLRFALNLTYDQADAFISSVVDNLCSNFNIYRNTALKSRGYVRLYFKSSDILNITQPLQFSTQDGIAFQTKNSFINYVPSYDYASAAYIVDCSVESTIAGARTNVEIGSITQILTPYPNLSRVSNITRTRFGTDIETNLELLVRTQNALVSRESSVVGGLLTRIRNYPGVLDAVIVKPGDAEAIRPEKNALDIYIIADERIQMKEDIFNSQSAAYAWERMNDEIDYEIYPVSTTDGYTYFKLLSQPAIEVSAVSIATTVGGVFSTISGDLVKDENSVYKYSVKGHDYVRIDNTLLTSPLCWVKINYSYDRLYKDLQNLTNSYDNSGVGSDILYKKGQEKYVDISVKFSLVPGYSFEIVQGNIFYNLNRFFDGGQTTNGISYVLKKLGENVQKSDILNVILDTEGVDDVDITFFDTSIDGVLFTRISNIKLYQYLRLGNITYL